MTDKPKLAKKQKRVLNLLEKGKSPSDVAKTLKISVNGVYGHMRRIEAKGYEVPRGRASNGRPAPARKQKARTNGSGPVDQIDAGIAKLIAQADERSDKILVEIKELSSQATQIEDRVSDLHAEQKEIQKRRKALASA